MELQVASYLDSCSGITRAEHHAYGASRGRMLHFRLYCAVSSVIGAFGERVELCGAFFRSGQNELLAS